MTKPKVKGIGAGIYHLGKWTIMPTEGECRSPGYTWFAHDGDHQEVLFGSLKAAKQYVLKQEGYAG